MFALSLFIIMVVLIFIMQEVHWSALGPAGASAVDKISPNQSYSSPTILVVIIAIVITIAIIIIIAIVINVKMVERAQSNTAYSITYNLRAL